MSCRLSAGIQSTDDFWQLLSQNRDAIEDAPAYRWQGPDWVENEAGVPIPIRKGGFIHQVEMFDAAFFHISPKEASHMDPQHRLLLEESWYALENAAIPVESLRNSLTGVFIGIYSHDYEHLQAQAERPEDLGLYYATGNSASIAAGRLAYFYNLKGPALSIDTACSSSLVATHEACKSLQRGECHLALVGGVNLILSPQLSIAFAKAGMLSADGYCKSFDANADGYVRGEGCAVIVLKRLNDAKRDHDNILAVIKGSAINQDGLSNGITAPNQAAQVSVLQAALNDARLLASSISYLETHGTGTKLGDPD